MNSSMKKKSALEDLLAVMAKLRSPEGCPWDREQDHMTLRQHAVEEVYELMDAIEARDDQEMKEISRLVFCIPKTRNEKRGVPEHASFRKAVRDESQAALTSRALVSDVTSLPRMKARRIGLMTSNASSAAVALSPTAITNTACQP